MKYSLILAHPKPGSFNHALAQAALAPLRSRGHEIAFHDLYAECFDPVMSAGELAKDAILPDAIRRHSEEIVAADGIIIIHPNWWSQPPAILKGWLDRVLRAGSAYQFVSGPNGEGRSVGLLKAKNALVIITANTPQEKEVALFGDPLGVLWEKVVFGLCGVPNVQRLVFTPVIVSSIEQRQQWLRQVSDTVDRIFSSP
jgi:NAD(P)H dehydrogenase (quinone)